MHGFPRRACFHTAHKTRHKQALNLRHLTWYSISTLLIFSTLWQQQTDDKEDYSAMSDRRRKISCNQPCHICFLHPISGRMVGISKLRISCPSVGASVIVSMISRYAMYMNAGRTSRAPVFHDQNAITCLKPHNVSEDPPHTPLVRNSTGCVHK